MPKDPIKLLVNFVAVLAIVGYYSAILYLGIPKWHDGASDHALKIVSGIVTAIAGALATFFGAAVGLKQAKFLAWRATSGAPLTPLHVPAAWAKFMVWRAGPEGRLDRVAPLTWLQVLAAWAYFLSLVLAFLLWAVQNFEKEMAGAVSGLALSLPGVMAGILAVAISLRPPGKETVSTH